jgi:hypothetical protein
MTETALEEPADQKSGPFVSPVFPVRSERRHHDV